MAAAFDLDKLKGTTLVYTEAFRHTAQANGSNKELGEMVDTAEELAEIHKANDTAIRVKHTLRFKGWKSKYLTSFRYHDCAWETALAQVTMNDIRLLAYIESHCMFGYNWIVFHGGKARERLGKDKSAISVSLKSLVKAGVLLEFDDLKNSTLPEVLEMADNDFENANYLRKCQQVYENITDTKWTPHHRILRLNYRIAWYGRLMWLMRSPSNNFSSAFKGRSAEFVGAYNLYGTLPGLLFGLKESAGLPAWESYFELLKEAKRAGVERPGVVYGDWE